MTLIQLIIFLAVIVAVGWAAHWLIGKFIEPPLRMPALLIVGVVLLVVLLSQFLPGFANYKVW